MDPIFEPAFMDNPEPTEFCNELRHLKLHDFNVILTKLREEHLDSYIKLVAQVRAANR